MRLVYKNHIINKRKERTVHLSDTHESATNTNQRLSQYHTNGQIVMKEFIKCSVVGLVLHNTHLGRCMYKTRPKMFMQFYESTMLP